MNKAALKSVHAFAVGGTVIFHLGQDRFKKVVGDRIEYQSAFVRLLCTHFRIAINCVTMHRNRGRFNCSLANYLRLADRRRRRTKDSMLIDLRLSQEDLAVMIGIGRQTINRLLKSLEQDIATVRCASITIQKQGHPRATSRVGKFTRHLSA